MGTGILTYESMNCIKFVVFLEKLTQDIQFIQKVKILFVNLQYGNKGLNSVSFISVRNVVQKA